MRKKELEIESMVGKDGREMWRKIGSIGPPVKLRLIPEEVIIEGKSEIRENLVLDKWKNQFASLYSGNTQETTKFDNVFLTRVQENLRKTIICRQQDNSKLNEVISYLVLCIGSNLGLKFGQNAPLESYYHI